MKLFLTIVAALLTAVLVVAAVVAIVLVRVDQGVQREIDRRSAEVRATAQCAAEPEYSAAAACLWRLHQQREGTGQ